MEKNVGSVDIEELRKAREELDRERGVESSPDMYANYNPNRNAEEESSANELEQMLSSDPNEEPVKKYEEPAQTDLSSNEPDSEKLDIDALASEILDDDSLENILAESIENELNELSETQESQSSAESEVSTENPQTIETNMFPEQNNQNEEVDLSIYDNFAAFEVGENQKSAANEVSKPQETVLSQDGDDDDEIIVDFEDFSKNNDIFETDSNNETNFEIKSHSEDELNLEEDENEFLDPTKTTGLLNLDDFETSSDLQSVEESSDDNEDLQSDNEKVANEEVENIETNEGFEDLDSFEIETPKTEEPVIEESRQVESSAEELTNINNLQNEEIENATSSVKNEKQNTDSLEIAQSYKQLKEFMQNDEEAEKLIQELTEEVHEEAEANEEQVEEVKHKYNNIDSFKFLDVISTDEFKNSDKLSYVIGKNEEDEMVYGNLRDSYNIAVFGKETDEQNNLIHSILLSLILKNATNEINFIMCDSKADSKFEVYNKSSYMYFNRIAKTNKEILDTLIEIAKELDERYKLFAEIGVKSIEQYNTIAKNDGMKQLPYLLTVFNNYSKSIQLTNSDKINALLYQILKYGRIAGLYLIVVANMAISSEEINYNLPTRLSFKAEDANRSLTTIGVAGAESLGSNEDMLYSSLENEKEIHLKVATLTKPEIELLIENIEE